MVEHGDRVRFAQEASPGRVIEVVVRQQKLECDRATPACVVGTIDHAHASRPERLVETEVINGASGETERIGSTRSPE